ncbi:MAG: isoleucine--tRNA ligase [Actinomycetota bacterium]|nr:isoleucine--tRNA ligase [Actinomycetota bacterium]
MPQPLYREVDARVSWPELEERVLSRWKEDRVFEASLAERSEEREWVFYEGPPTANGRPGIHHVEARTFKDIFCRFQTMRGRLVYRKGGWDCHGLGVEIDAEKKLGVTHKRQIEEEVGIAAFVELCRESVTEYVDEWARLTDRIGFWIDLDGAYWTMSRDFIESVWWLLKQIWDKGLLEEDFKVVPYCPRCETALSSHEQHQPDAYKTVEDPSVYVRFTLVDEPDTALLVWTTTPWTLLANMAAAVGPGIDYVKVEDPLSPGHFLIVAEARAAALLGDGFSAVATYRGQDLVGRAYNPPFRFVPTEGSAHTVTHGEFVTTEDGSGIVHLAPYGEEDMGVAKRDNLPIVQMIDPSGQVAERGEPFSGLGVKEADPRIVEDLRERELLFRSELYSHAYPHCWRCDTPLLYYPRKDFYIRTSQIRNELQASNEDTEWQPPTIKYGRFGDWLANNVDWSLSRDRYWGTPLPIWRCDNDHLTCVGSFSELEELSGEDLSELDPHRPYIDEVSFRCPQCGAQARRTKSVIDAWFDSGSMPFAQWHYPFENEDIFDARFPADFISEAIDQTRGWFYSLLAVATLLRGRNSFKNVVCLGHIVDSDGRKMSKRLGNVIDPWEVVNKHGADALRWYMITGGTPWSARRVSHDIIQESLRRYLLTLWNTYSFWVTYASLESFDPKNCSVPVAQRSELDRWILAELDDTVRHMSASLEAFDATGAGRRLDRLVDDLSNWYVRRSRRRFWKSAAEADTKAAFLTLWECLVTIAKLSAPFTPFVADEIYTNLTGTGAEEHESVHLARWPQPDAARADDSLRTGMALARRLVALGRAARTDARVRVRQPLSRALIVMPRAEADLLEDLEPLMAEELNVKAVEVAHGLQELVTYSIRPNFKLLGPRFGATVKDVARALSAADAQALTESLESTGNAIVDLDGEPVSLSADELDVRIEGREGFSLAREGAYGVALDLELDGELIAEGIAREVVRAVQELRKSSGLAVSDRIELWLESEDETVAEALEQHRDAIASEVLATTVNVNEHSLPEAQETELALDQGAVRIVLRG